MHICNLWQHAERTLFWSLPTTGLCLFCLGNQIMSALPISTTLNLCFPILSPIFVSETKRANIYKSWIFCWVLDFQNLTFPNYLFAVTDLLPQPLEVKIFAQWGHIWKDIVEKNQMQPTWIHAGDLRRHLKAHNGERSNKCMWFRIYSGRQFETAFESSQ